MWQYREFPLPSGAKDRMSISEELRSGWELIGIRPSHHGGRVRHSAVMRRKVVQEAESSKDRAGQLAAV